MRVVVGIGARAGVDAADVVAAISAVLQPDWHVEAIASIDRKAELVVAVASSMGVRGVTYSARELSTVVTPTVSVRVLRAVGSASVAEAAALLAGGSTELTVPRLGLDGVTVAVVELCLDGGQGVRAIL
ncbi:cobalamin biosynthesis protein [Rhodococcus sp. ARC_M12]|uniref:Cobalamin biosynthesis protein n=1 Tax=Rhodococcus navarretei TaxID=3128981 RepID=A0ABU9CYW8_9NOCA|nr:MULTISPECIES: cobalamin biosynthesis protein [unclassified Rhodococcus (in: high G+C Gram-positive bacteria)]MCJ0893275.1 cobalamin biosynthesis protein [Rhodococcus sp. ARC_M5]MCJ0976467.1 cobalamin biosynthesis protein [Rhodococcus sp. ARC_M12]